LLPSTSIELEAVRKDAIESKAKVHGGGKDDFGYGGEAVDILYQGLSSAQPIRPAAYSHPTRGRGDGQYRLDDLAADVVEAAGQVKENYVPTGFPSRLARSFAGILRPQTRQGLAFGTHEI